MFLMFLMPVGSVDGQIKRWDISGEGKKKETEIIKTVEKNEKKAKKTNLTDENSDKNDVKEKSEKSEPEKKNEKSDNKEKKDKVEEIEKAYPKRRFLDYYFEDAIRAEIMRKNSVDSGPGKTVPVNGKIKSGNAGKGSRESPMVAKVTNALSEVPVEGCVVSVCVGVQGEGEV